MQRTIYFIYDDSLELPFSIKSVVGNRTFGRIIHKRVTLREKIRTLLQNAGIEHIIEITQPEERHEIINRFKEKSFDSIFIHFFSKAVIVDPEKFLILLKKIVYSQSTSINQEVDPYLLVFTNISDYAEYIKLLDKNQTITKADLGDETLLISPDGFAIDISDIASFLNFFSSGFEARYFNQLIGDAHTLVKKSADKEKILKEYHFYRLIPELIKKWYVMPYDLKIEDEYASYTMERLNVPDMALQWIHNSVSVRDFSTFLDKIFSFISSRPVRMISKDKYLRKFNDLYFQKVLDRIKKLENTDLFQKLHTYIVNGTEYTLDKIIEDYHKLYNKLVKEVKEYQEVIGHGDLCFSNILYDKNTYMMKFIDAKGALKEEDLWIDPYYDLAKLSHSILGNYDFINNELFTVTLDHSLSLLFSLKSRSLNQHKELFIEKVKQTGFDIRLIRLCEASLFLSMLPLHIDNPRKVLGFILNAIQIIEELEQNV